MDYRNILGREILKQPELEDLLHLGWYILDRVPQTFQTFVLQNVFLGAFDQRAIRRMGFVVIDREGDSLSFSGGEAPAGVFELVESDRKDPGLDARVASKGRQALVNSQKGFLRQISGVFPR
ncbi:MAG: hypothetical protein AAF604_22530 [Acidobacteriota bacterium]